MAPLPPSRMSSIARRNDRSQPRANKIVTRPAKAAARNTTPTRTTIVHRLASAVRCATTARSCTSTICPRSSGVTTGKLDTMRLRRHVEWSKIAA